MWRVVSLAIVVLLSGSVYSRSSSCPFEKREWSQEELEQLSAEEKAAVAIWRLAMYSVSEYVDLKRAWDLEDFVRSDFNLLRDVKNPYTGEPVRWGSDAPGDVWVKVVDDRVLVRVKWARRPPKKAVLYSPEKQMGFWVYAEPRLGWYLQAYTVIPRPVTYQEWRRWSEGLDRKLQTLQGADLRWYLLCSFLSGAVWETSEERGPGFVEQLKRDPTVIWWAVLPDLRNPYTGERVRVVDQREPGSLTVAWYTERMAIVFCWDREGKEIRGYDEMADQLVPARGGAGDEAGVISG